MARVLRAQLAGVDPHGEAVAGRAQGVAHQGAPPQHLTECRALPKRYLVALLFAVVAIALVTAKRRSQSRVPQQGRKRGPFEGVVATVLLKSGSRRSSG